MNSLTLGLARQTISRIEGVCSNADEVRDLINEAEVRLLNRPDYPVGSLVRVRTCAGVSDCICLKRQIQTIQSFAVCGSPGTVRPGEWEFIGYPNGNGLADENSSYPGNVLIDRGTSCAFDDVVATTTEPRRIAAIASNTADVGKKITLRYINSSGQKVYSSIDSTVQEGEQLTLVSPLAAFPSNAAVVSQDVQSGGLYHVVKEVTEYPIYLYEYDPTPVVDPASITKLLAQYEPSEEVPIYRRAFVPGLTQQGACSGSTNDDCTSNKQITALVKLQHVPVVVDNDPLVIGNLAALKLMVMAIMREEANRLEESAVLEAKARAEIDGELSSYLGDGMKSEIKMQNNDIFGAGQAAYLAGFYW